MDRTIQYAIDTSTGLVVSRVGSELAWPVLDYEGMKPENNFATSYDLERVSIFSVASYWPYLFWTRKVSVPIKNAHRKFWGMKSLAEVQS